MNAISTAIEGPHRHIATESRRERFALDLFDRLWHTYRQRVEHVAAYERVVAAAGARFVNDHIAFRTLANQQPQTGIASVSRIFEALGYAPANNYVFADKHLTAIHYQHPHGEFPKLFISELRVWELSDALRSRIESTLQSHRPAISAEVLATLERLDISRPLEEAHADRLMQTLVNCFEELPWPVPEKEDVLAADHESQYAAWVLVHGYRVNHFTSLINSHRVAALDDLEKTIAALQTAGVPMKAEIEGERGSILRQSATAAAMSEVQVADNGKPTTMPWSYAYFELAERGETVDAATGRRGRFEGFLGPQATNLFEMTKVK